MTGILEICQEAADVTATKRPDDLFNKNVEHDTIFLAVAKNELDSLMRFGHWQELMKEGVFRTVKGKTVYRIEEIVPDFYALSNNTIFIKDLHEKIYGAVTSEQWAREKYFVEPNCQIKFKIQNDCFKFLTPPPEGVKIVFEYRSNTICLDAQTFEEKSALTKNSDIPIFDKYLVKLGIIWRWLKRGGLDYTEEYEEYRKELKKKFGTGLSCEDISPAAGGGVLSQPLNITVINRG